MQVFYPNDSGQFSIAQGVSEKVQKSKNLGGGAKFFFKLHDFLYIIGNLLKNAIQWHCVKCPIHITTFLKLI